MTKISNQYSLTNILTADLANSRLGINNVSPTVALDVTGAGKFSSTIFVNAPLNNTVITTSDATNITNGFNLLGSSSYWGIRTATSGNFNLDVYGAGATKNALSIAQSTGAALFSNTETTFNFNTQTSLLAGYNYLNFGGGSIMYRNNTDIYIGSNAKYGASGTVVAGYTSAAGMGLVAIDGGAFYYQANATSVTAGTAYAVPTRFYINGNGNVGIGTITPNIVGFTGPMLTVNGSGNYQGFEVATGGVSRIVMISNGTLGLISTRQSGMDIVFEAGAASEKMRITSGGNVLINTTTSSGSDRQLQVAGSVYSSGTNSGYFWENRSNSANYYGWYTTSGTVYLFNGSANIASINASSGAYTALSDINKKKDFEDSSLGLNAILGLKPKLFRMKDENETSSKHLGFIAQEVKDFIPQAFVQTKGEKEDFIGLDDRPIIATLVKAIQELSAENTSLINRIEALENK
jgi:hypothetical protein